MKFSLGKTVATPGAIEFCDTSGINIVDLLIRHAQGDWGDLDKEDKQANEDAIKSGARIFSSYDFPSGKVWVITTGDDDDGLRESTCVLLPSEY